MLLTCSGNYFLVIAMVIEYIGDQSSCIDVAVLPLVLVSQFELHRCLYGVCGSLIATFKPF